MTPALATVLAQPIAHRGLHDASRGVVENSLAAAEAAVVRGFGIECDVQRAADGEAMVFHDDTLQRLTSADGRVDALNAHDLSQLTLTGGHDTIATLPTFLDRLKGRVPLVVEIKSRFDGDMRLATRVVEVVAAYHGPIALKSFDPAVMAHCRKLAAPCPLGLVGSAEDKGTFPSETMFEFISWHVKSLPTLSNPSNLPLMSWTVRSSEDHEIAKRFGAQIVFEHYSPGLNRA